MFRLTAVALLLLGCAENTQHHLPTQPSEKNEKQPPKTIWQDCLAGEMGSCSLIESYVIDETLQRSLAQVFCHATENPYYCFFFKETVDREEIERQACNDGIISACAGAESNRKMVTDLCFAGKNIMPCILFAKDGAQIADFRKQVEPFRNKSAAYRWGGQFLQALEASLRYNEKEQAQQLRRRLKEASRNASDPITKSLLLVFEQEQAKKLNRHLTKKVEDYFQVHRLTKKTRTSVECIAAPMEPGCNRGQPDSSGPKTSKVPPVRIGTPSVVGNLDKSIIRRYIRRKLPQIKYCYEKQVLIQPGIGGTVVTKFVIGSNGLVKQSTANGLHPNVSSCVAAVLKAIRFPKPRSGEVKVQYPFRFNPPK